VSLLRRAWLAYVGAASAVAGLAAIAVFAGSEVDVPWAPTLGIRLAFALDGLAVLYGVLATGIGALVFVYAARYVPLHLAHQGRSPREATRLYGFLLLFMVSMVGLVTAQDLILLFVFWDLTAVSSYFLIAFDRQRRDARYAALMALLVTGVTAVFLLIGTIILHAEYGTFSLPELFEAAEPGTPVTVAALLIALAGLAKSAQVPFQFWLPRAMAAPTPVSAYLHSAAMVAAGVFLLGRTYPLLEQSRLLLDLLLVVGMASMAVGGVIALTRDDLKQLLANSTIAQYGYVTFMLGIGGPGGVAAASFYVLAHALMKSALFLSAGAVAETTGETRLSRLGGLGRDRPLLAVGSGLAAAGLGALPLTVGFFKDELFFEAALERGAPFAAVAVASAALTLAYIGRFWIRIFLGRPAGERRAVPAALVWPVVVLGALVGLGGIVVEPLARFADAAASVSFGEAIESAPAYHLDLSPPNLMAVATYAAGIAALLTTRLWSPFAEAAARFGDRAGPERWYDLTLAALNRLSDRIHGIEVRDIRVRVAAVLVPAGVLVALAALATPAAYELGVIGRGDVSLALVLCVSAVAALAATVPRHHLTLVLVLSTVGFSLAVVYAFFGGPDVALVAVLVETILAILFLGVFALLPRRVLRREAALPMRESRRWRDPLVAVIAGFFAFVVVWGALSRPAPEMSVAADHIRLAPEVHAADVVTAILADFRGLDTLGEITVVAIALVGIAALLRRGRLWE
jgi:multicomponent Na+:H+ antiporter subunit A